jgi:hypothetical protein
MDRIFAACEIGSARWGLRRDDDERGKDNRKGVGSGSVSNRASGQNGFGGVKKKIGT